MPPFLRFLVKRFLAVPITLIIITMVLYAGVMLTPPEVCAQRFALPAGGRGEIKPL